MAKRPSYWSGTPQQFNLITEIQELKREYAGDSHKFNAHHSDDYVMTNPVTGKSVPIADLKYARDHLNELYSSGQIREDRWAFLWYH